MLHRQQEMVHVDNKGMLRALSNNRLSNEQTSILSVYLHRYGCIDLICYVTLVYVYNFEIFFFSYNGGVAHLPLGLRYESLT